MQKKLVHFSYYLLPSLSLSFSLSLSLSLSQGRKQIHTLVPQSSKSSCLLLMFFVFVFSIIVNCFSLEVLRTNLINFSHIFHVLFLSFSNAQLPLNFLLLPCHEFVFLSSAPSSILKLIVYKKKLCLHL